MDGHVAGTTGCMTRSRQETGLSSGPAHLQGSFLGKQACLLGVTGFQPNSFISVTENSDCTAVQKPRSSPGLEHLGS